MVCCVPAAGFNDLSEYENVEFNLYTDAGNVERLYTARQESGKAYDAYFNDWLANHNDGLAACAYSVNYMGFVEDLTSGYLADLNTEKGDISKHCSNIPTMESFDVTKVRMLVVSVSVKRKRKTFFIRRSNE